VSKPFFQLFLSEQWMLFLGTAFDTGLHRHHAAQLAVGLEGLLGIQGHGGDHWRRARAFYVPPDVSHRLDSGQTACAILYLDPESVQCERACQRFGGCDISAVELGGEAMKRLAGLLGRESGPEQINDVCAGLLKDEMRPAPRELDARLQRVLDWVDGNLTKDIRQSEAAAVAGVSESWLSHRFGVDIGVPLRRYILWRRLRTAVQAAMAGNTLTEAAHKAGFSDSAHLTRTFRESFGVAPSFLFGQRDRVAVTFLDRRSLVSTRHL